MKPPHFDSVFHADDPESLVVLEGIKPLGGGGRWIGVSKDGVWIWDRDGRLTAHIATPTCLDSSCLAVSPSAGLAVTSRVRHGLALYDLTKECHLETLGLAPGEVQAAVFLDEYHVASGCGAATQLWDLAAQSFTQLDAPGMALAYDARRERLAIAGIAGYVGVYDLRKAPQLVWQKFVSAPAPTTRQRLSSEQRATIGIVWNRPCVTVTHAQLTPNGEMLVTGGRDDALRIWDARNGEQLDILLGHSFWINGLSIHPSGQWALSSSADGTIRLWDLEGRRCHTTLELGGRPEGVVFSPDGTMFCCIEGQNRVIARSFDEC